MILSNVFFCAFTVFSINYIGKLDKDKNEHKN
jgi:hypothetical protein